ncbi:hypothetical protein ACFLZH_06160 [Patescibacteria group bacterium]
MNFKTGNISMTPVITAILSLIGMIGVSWVARNESWNPSNRWRILAIIAILLLVYIPLNVGSLFLVGTNNGEIIYCDGKRMPRVGGDLVYRTNLCQVQTASRIIEVGTLATAKTSDGVVVKRCLVEDVRIPKSKFDFKLGLVQINGRLGKELTSQMKHAFASEVSTLTSQEFLAMHDLRFVRKLQFKLAHIERRDGLLFGEVVVAKKRRCSR